MLLIDIKNYYVLCLDRASYEKYKKQHEENKTDDISREKSKRDKESSRRDKDKSYSAEKKRSYDSMRDSESDRKEYSKKRGSVERKLVEDCHSINSLKFYILNTLCNTF